jgi:hypothetical protein
MNLNMKTIISVFIITSIFLFMLISCEPESNVVDPPDYLIIDTSSTNYSFRENIDKVVYASLWGSNLMEYKVDLNHDSIDDIQFSCSVYHHTVSDEWYSGINILNENITLDIDQDTAQYASYYEKYPIPSSDSGTIYFKENYNSSKLYPSNVKITDEIEKFPVIHSIGDTLSDLCNWKTGGVMLEYADHSWGAVHNNLQSGAWRGIDHKYIGIRFSDKAISYYGWVEIGVNDFHISLYKQAFEMK